MQSSLISMSNCDTMDFNQKLARHMSFDDKCFERSDSKKDLRIGCMKRPYLKGVGWRWEDAKQKTTGFAVQEG